MQKVWTVWERKAQKHVANVSYNVTNSYLAYISPGTTFLPDVVVEYRMKIPSGHFPVSRTVSEIFGNVRELVLI